MECTMIVLSWLPVTTKLCIYNFNSHYLVHVNSCHCTHVYVYSYRWLLVLINLGLKCLKHKKKHVVVTSTENHGIKTHSNLFGRCHSRCLRSKDYSNTIDITAFVTPLTNCSDLLVSYEHLPWSSHQVTTLHMAHTHHTAANIHSSLITCAQAPPVTHRTRTQAVIKYQNHVC